MNSRVSKYMKPTLTELKIDKFIIRVGDFNMPLSVTDKISRQKSLRI